jgi:hypothetical protein
MVVTVILSLKGRACKNNPCTKKAFQNKTECLIYSVPKDECVTKLVCVL